MAGTKGASGSSSSNFSMQNVYTCLGEHNLPDERPTYLFYPVSIQMPLGTCITNDSIARLRPTGVARHMHIAARASCVKIDATAQKPTKPKKNRMAATQTDITHADEKTTDEVCSLIKHHCDRASKKIPESTTQEKKEQQTKALEAMSHLLVYVKQLESEINPEHQPEVLFKESEQVTASKVSSRQSSVAGMGCFADKEIKANELLGLYQGDFVFRMFTESDQFIAFKRDNKTGRTIFLEEDKHVAWTDVLLQGTHYEIGISGKSEFSNLNHSSTPNCVLWVLIDGKYKREKKPAVPAHKLDVIEIEIRSLSNITKGEELFFDYQAGDNKPIDFDENLVVMPTDKQIAEVQTTFNRCMRRLEMQDEGVTETDFISPLEQQLKNLPEESKDIYNQNKNDPGFCRILKEAIKKNIPLASLLGLTFEDFDVDDELLWNNCSIIWRELGSIHPTLSEEFKNALLALYISKKELSEATYNKIDYSIQIYWHLSKLPDTWQVYVENNLLPRKRQSERSTIKRTAASVTTETEIQPRKKSR